MTQKERLVELLYNSRGDFEEIADYLLEHGVTVPPVQIGQKVFSTDYGYINTLHVMRIRPLIKTEIFDYYPEDFGKTVFFTGGDAEAALKGEQNNE